MVRRVWLPREVAGGEGLVGEGELGRAPFALLIEHLPPVRQGEYRIRAQIKVASAEVMGLIDRHRLREVEVYVDREAKALAEREAELREELDAATSAAGMLAVWSPAVMGVAGRMVAGWVKGLGVVRISFGTLLEGIEIKGTFEETRRIAKELTFVIDRLAVQIDAGRAFEAGEIRVYSPGSKTRVKETTPGVPPSEWEG